MILVDSSAFIEFYRPAGRHDVQDFVSKLIRDDQVAVNGIIQVEIISFASSQSDQLKLKSDFSAFHWITLSKTVFDDAVELGFNLRSGGITVPATDLIIAASAIASGSQLYHLDSHFDMIAQCSDLKSFNPGSNI